jgi:hypothetical protein
MTVRELIEKLYGMNPSSTVRVCSDSNTIDCEIVCIESGNQDNETIIYYFESN